LPCAALRPSDTPHGPRGALGPAHLSAGHASRRHASRAQAARAFLHACSDHPPAHNAPAAGGAALRPAGSCRAHAHRPLPLSSMPFVCPGQLIGQWHECERAVSGRTHTQSQGHTNAPLLSSSCFPGGPGGSRFSARMGGGLPSGVSTFKYGAPLYGCAWPGPAGSPTFYVVGGGGSTASGIKNRCVRVRVCAASAPWLDIMIRACHLQRAPPILHLGGKALHLCSTTHTHTRTHAHRLVQAECADGVLSDQTGEFSFGSDCPMRCARRAALCMRVRACSCAHVCACMHACMHQCN